MLIRLRPKLVAACAVFGLFAAVAWWLLELLRRATSRAPTSGSTSSRIPRCAAASEDKRRQEDRRRCRSMLEKASPALAKPLQPKNELEAGKLKLKLAQRRLPQRSRRRASSWA